LFSGTQVRKRRRVLYVRYQSQDERLRRRLRGNSRRHRACSRSHVAGCSRSGRGRRQLADTDAVEPRTSVAAGTLGALRGHVDRAVGARPAGEADLPAVRVARVMPEARVSRATEDAAVRSAVVELRAGRRLA